MAIVYMDDVYVRKYTPYRNVVAFEYEEEMEASGNGNTVIVPDNITGVSVLLYVSAGGGGAVEYSLTPSADIIANEANALWESWDHGDVAETTSGYCKPVTALRMVNGSGTTRLSLRAQ